MPLPQIRGHAEIRTLLARVGRTGSLPQSILLHGPAGVGKERLGLWLAGLLVCDEPEAPCGSCVTCQQVGKLQHPDVHWFFPQPRPDASSPEKLRDKLEEQRGAELQKWRDDPFRIVEHEKAPAHFLAAVRTVQQMASLRPSAGRRKVFVIGDAELMVPQESSQEAANAFLKLLEEPPTETTFILTSSQPGALLPTIRSRVLSMRVGLVPEAEIGALLVETGRVEGESATTIARRAGGSVRRALRIASNLDGADADRKAGRELLIAALTQGPLARLAAAHEQRPAGARNTLSGPLDGLTEWLRDLLAVASGAEERVTAVDSLPILRRAVGPRKVPTEGVMRAIDRVSTARQLAYGNVNPQLILADLLRNIQKDLLPADDAGTGARS